METCLGKLEVWRKDQNSNHVSKLGEMAQIITMEFDKEKSPVLYLGRQN